MRNAEAAKRLANGMEAHKIECRANIDQITGSASFERARERRDRSQRLRDPVDFLQTADQ